MKLSSNYRAKLFLTKSLNFIKIG